MKLQFSMNPTEIFIKEPDAFKATFLLSLKKLDMKTLLLSTGPCSVDYDLEKSVVSALEKTALYFVLFSDLTKMTREGFLQ